MTDAEKDYFLSGQAYAYHQMSQVINQSLKRNNGTITAPQLVQVFNEIVSHVEYFTQELKERQEKPTQDALLEAIKLINKELEGKIGNVVIFKGGN